MIKKNFLLIIVLLMSILAIVLSVISFSRTTSKVVYVDLMKLHEGFQLKKELSMEMEKIKVGKQHTLDSLKVDYEISVRKNENKDLINQKAEIYRLKDQQMEKDFEALAQNYEQKVWNQLNVYATKYGENHHLDLLIGLTGTGNVMYGDKRIDVTEDLIEYTNRMYSGKSDK